MQKPQTSIYMNENAVKISSKNIRAAKNKSDKIASKRFKEKLLLSFLVY